MSKKNKRNSNKRVRVKRGNWRDERQLVGASYSLPVHPGLTSITCPDCAAHWDAPTRQRRPGNGGAFTHATTCPIGKGYADASDDDRAWFAAHQGETERVRTPTMAEVQAVMMVTGQALPDMPNGGELAPGGQVIVTKLSDELRRRDFSGAMLLVAPALSTADGIHPDEFDETGQLWFREHVAPGESRDDDGLWSW